MEHCLDELVIVRTSVCAVHIDEMNPARSRTRERLERRERLGKGAMGAQHAPAFDVNGGEEVHEMKSVVGCLVVATGGGTGHRTQRRRRHGHTAGLELLDEL